MSLVEEKLFFAAAAVRGGSKHGMHDVLSFLHPQSGCLLLCAPQRRRRLLRREEERMSLSTHCLRQYFLWFDRQRKERGGNLPSLLQVCFLDVEGVGSFVSVFGGVEVMSDRPSHVGEVDSDEL